METLNWPKVQHLPLEQKLLIWTVFPPTNYPHFISHYADEIGYSFVSQQVYSSQHKFRWILPRCKHRSVSSSFLLKSPTHLPNHYPIQTQTKTPALWAKSSLQLTALAVASVTKGELHTGAQSGVRVGKYFANPGVCVCVKGVVTAVWAAGKLVQFAKVIRMLCLSMPRLTCWEAACCSASQNFFTFHYGV